ncbi:hypothetical protein [Leptodesmis sichuanensis]|uniref:hypothetical protein n=1 Tax=Leptodesmis sichuanensis TaxID=2906798 RepID=UPI001F2BD02B|nr:hypothetical protein [Leptodesmis sichuanensis]
MRTASGKHWVSEIECSRLIQWNGTWQRVDVIAEPLRQQHRESFRPLSVECRNGATKPVVELPLVKRNLS